MSKEVIHTDSAPTAIGTYSQAIKAHNTVYLSGQIPLNPETMQLVSTGFTDQLHQVFSNLREVVIAAQASLNDIVKLNIYLTNLENFAVVNEVMAEYFRQPFPARAVIGVAALPKGASVEIDGILVV